MLFRSKKELFRQAGFWVCSVAMLAVQAAFLVWSGSFKLILWLVCMLTAVGLMYVFIKLAGKLSHLATGYCCVKAFLLAEFAASFEWQLMMYVGGRQMSAAVFRIINSLMILAVYGADFAVTVRLEKKVFDSDYLKRLTVREVLASVGIAVAVFVLDRKSVV